MFRFFYDFMQITHNIKWQKELRWLQKKLCLQAMWDDVEGVNSGQKIKLDGVSINRGLIP
jgi:hypothetical protein